MAQTARVGFVTPTFAEPFSAFVSSDICARTGVEYAASRM